MKSNLLIAGGALLAALPATIQAAPAKGAAKPAAKPNVIIILADDLGYGDLSCQYSSDMRTPSIDALFTGGLRLDQFYANSNVSSPSRAGLLSGCFPDMVGVPGVIRTQPQGSWGWLSPGAVLMPQILKQAGYATAMSGKWHLGLSSPNLPWERGFDHSLAFLGDKMDDYFTHLRNKQNLMRLDGVKTDAYTGRHATEVFTDWAVDYIAGRAKQPEPFFLYLAYNAPHDPLQPPVEWLDKVKARQPKINDTRASYVALVEHMDYNVGRVVEALRKSGQLENTIVIFTSDNGGARSNKANNGPLRGYKGDVFEGGIRVVCTAYWKGVIEPRREERLVMMSDILPTLCDLIQAPLPRRIDGISVLPLIRGEEQATDDRYLFWVRREHGDLGGKTQNAVRRGDDILMQNRPFEAMQLFNLKNDPGEENPLPLSGDPYQSLFKAMTEHYRQSGAVPWQKPLED